MKKNSPNTEIIESIDQLEIKFAQELILLRAEINEIPESLSPNKLIKNTFKAVTPFNDFKKGIGATFIGLASGFLVKKILFGNTINPLKIAAGFMVQTVVAGLVVNNIDEIDKQGKKLLKNITSKAKH